jgi:hypothetical protein
MMPQSATLDRPATTTATVPAPRTEQDPHTWVRGLCSSQLALALTLSDMPRTTADRDQAVGGYLPAQFPHPRRLTPAGVRVVNAWVAQGTERAGGLLALWQAANQWREMNRDRTWNTPQGKAFFRRFGNQRRLNSAVSMARYVPTEFDPIMVRVRTTEATEHIVCELNRSYTPEDESRSGVAVFQMRRHDARMAAVLFGRALAPHFAGGYSLA